MKILICDYQEELKRNLDFEKELLHEGLGASVEILVVPYESPEQLKKAIKDVDVLLTAFIPVTKEIIDAVNKLKCIAINATGYGTIDLEAASKRKIAVCPILEYCTQEVAEHTMALLLALTRNLKGYEETVEKRKLWNYASVNHVERLAGQTLAIFGFGRIGKAVARRAQAFDMRVLAVDPYLSKEDAQVYGVEVATAKEALKRADVITNHMNQTSENKHFFGKETFEKMKNHPLFLNVGRGSAVEEKALVEALDTGILRGAALDVLETENPKLATNPLLYRENVLVTPHAAFYSNTSMRELQRISCENIIYFWKGEYDKVFWIANKDAVL